MLRVEGLKKRFGSVQAVDGVSFEVKPGTCVGLLGPNGAGKTTTVSMIAGLLRPDEGTVTVKGAALAGETDPKKRAIGLVPQDLALYEELSALDNMQFFGALYDPPAGALGTAVRASLEFVGLAERAKDKVKTFSGGMKRRLNMAASLLHDPELLILDEPTVGVNPQSRSAIFDNLEALKRRGKSIIYTTHYMEEAERLCDRIVIMDRGQVIADDTLRGLGKLVPAKRRVLIELEEGGEGVWLDELRGLDGVDSAELSGAEGAALLTVGVRDLGVAPAALAHVAAAGKKISHFSAERADLEGIFLSLTGRKLRDE